MEGESDKRFIEALLRLFDEGNLELHKTLSESGAATKTTGVTDGSLTGSSDLSVSVETSYKTRITNESFTLKRCCTISNKLYAAA